MNKRTTVTEAGNSLGDRVSNVIDAWHKGRDEYDSAVLDVFDDTLVVKMGTYRTPNPERKTYRIPYSVASDGVVTFADSAQWQAVMLDYVDVTTAPAEVSESLRGFIEESAGGNREAVIIVEGQSKNGRMYTRAALDSGVSVFEGAKMFVDHPTLSESAERPERSVRDLVGVVENVYVGKTRDGRTALKGTPRLASTAGWLQTLVNEGIAGALSIHAHGRGKHDNGQLIVESFVSSPATSVDFVTVAGAGGGFEMRESAPVWDALTVETLQQHRPDLVDALQESPQSEPVQLLMESEPAMTDNDEQRIAELEAQLAETQRRYADTLTQLRTQEATAALNEALGAGLPELAINRLKVMVQPTVDAYARPDSTTTREQLAESLSNIVTAEREYIASFGVGQINMPVMESAPADDDALYEAFAALTDNETMAKIAAKGRSNG